MNIRKVKKEDIKEIDKIYVDSSIRENRQQFPRITVNEMKKDLEKYKYSRLKNFLKEIKSRNYYWIVAEESGEIVGIGQAGIKNKSIGVLEKIYVSRKRVRQGIGFKLLKELEKWLISKKVKFIDVNIYYKNNPSIRLNEEAGYKPISIKMRKKVSKQEFLWDDRLSYIFINVFIFLLIL